MDIDIGATVYDINGHRVGSVDRIIINPANWEVTDIVVASKDYVGEDIIVSVSLIERAKQGEVHLRTDSKAVKEMPRFVEAEFAVPPPGGADVIAYNAGNRFVPLKPPFPEPYPVPPPEPPLPELAKEMGEMPFEIEDGVVVEAVDGTLGVVDAVLLDQYTNTITAFVVKTDGLLGRDITIPVEWVAEASSSGVKVAATVEQAKHLLGPPSGWYLPEGGRIQRRKAA